MVRTLETLSEVEITVKLLKVNSFSLKCWYLFHFKATGIGRKLTQLSRHVRKNSTDMKDKEGVSLLVDSLLVLQEHFSESFTKIEKMEADCSSNKEEVINSPISSPSFYLITFECEADKRYRKWFKSPFQKLFFSSFSISLLFCFSWFWREKRRRKSIKQISAAISPRGRRRRNRQSRIW